MSQLKITSIIMLLFSMNCCSSEQQQIFKNISTNIILSKQLSTDGIIMRYPFRVRILDSTLYIMDLHGPEYFCHVFSYPKIKHIASYGEFGKGPQKMLDAENIRIDTHKNILLLDANNMKIASIDSLSQQKKYNLDKSLIRPLDFALYRDSLFIVPDYTGMFRYHIVNKAGNIIKSHQSIPSHDNKKNALNILLAQAWRSFIDYNPHNGILAMATQLGEVVEIYDVNQDTIIHIFKGEAGEPEFLCREGYAIPNGIMGYSDIHVGDKYIYAIFWGRTFKDIRRNVNTPEGGKCIHIFDLQGNPISKINLDRYITGFDVDEAHHKIVALDVNSNQPLIEFSIPNL